VLPGQTEPPAPGMHAASELHVHRLGIIMESIGRSGDVAIAGPGEVIGHDRVLLAAIVSSNFTRVPAPCFGSVS